MNETQIVYFLTLADCGSFTETAYKLYVSQSAVSKQILALEKYLGCALFQRKKNAIQLTEAGELYRNFLSKFVAELQQVKEQAELVSKGLTKSLSICVKEYLRIEDLPLYVHMLRKSTPDIALKLRTDPAADLQKLFFEDRTDVVITYRDLLGDMNGLRSKLLCRAECRLIISRSHPLAYSRDVALSDFADSKFIVPPQAEDRFGRTFVEGICAENGFTPAITEANNSLYGILSAVECGLGVAIVDSCTQMYASGNFRQIPLGTFRDVMVVWPAAGANPSVDLFLEILAK